MTILLFSLIEPIINRMPKIGSNITGKLPVETSDGAIISSMGAITNRIPENVNAPIHTNREPTNSAMLKNNGNSIKFENPIEINVAQYFKLSTTVYFFSVCISY